MGHYEIEHAADGSSRNRCHPFPYLIVCAQPDKGDHNTAVLIGRAHRGFFAMGGLTGWAAFHSTRALETSLYGSLLRSTLFSFATTSMPFFLIVRIAETESLKDTNRSPFSQKTIFLYIFNTAGAR
jgi:hypothetical protein